MDITYNIFKLIQQNNLAHQQRLLVLFRTIQIY